MSLRFQFSVITRRSPGEPIFVAQVDRPGKPGDDGCKGWQKLRLRTSACDVT